MLETTIKNSLFLYIVGGLFVFLSLYVGAQFIIFSKQYEKDFLKEANQVEDEFKYILKSYQTILEKISHEIKKKTFFIILKQYLILYIKPMSMALSITKIRIKLGLLG